MHVPAHIQAALLRVDRHIAVTWNNRIQRWEIRRRDPVQTGKAPAMVRLWCTPDGTKYGAFLPLDERLIRWLYDKDLSRKWKNIDERRWGELLEREMLETETKARAAIDRDLDDQLDEARKSLEFAIRRGEHNQSATFGMKSGKKTVVGL